jgi:hypothetical protein
MIKPMQRKSVVPFGVRLSKGMSVQMDDGWRGRVETDHGDCIICIADGERPNDYLRGYRAFARRLLTVSGSKAMVNWKSGATASRSTTRVRRPPASVIDLDRARIEREWQSAPEY